MILDASVVIHWVVQTQFHRQATEFQKGPRCAPGHIMVEAANVLTKYIRGGFISRDDLEPSVRNLRSAMVELVPDGQLLEHAGEISLSNYHPIYDCLYIALAIERREPLATADKRMAALAERLGVETRLIRPE